MKLMHRIKIFGLLFFVSVCLVAMTSCGDVEDDHYQSNCDDEISERIAVSGEPDEIDIDPAESGSYHSHTYWYFSRGFAATFTCGDNVDGCELDTITFCPDCPAEILVSESPISGPNGKIIRFAVFDADTQPEVIVVTQNGSYAATLTTIDFKPGEKYFGRFDFPQSEIEELVINGHSIPWGFH